MRRLALLLVCLPLVTLACEDADRALEREAEAVTTAVPRAGITAELHLLRSQLALHKRMHGSYPERLEGLQTVSYLKYPDEYVYDPDTGAVKSRRFPEL